MNLVLSLRAINFAAIFHSDAFFFSVATFAQITVFNWLINIWLRSAPNIKEFLQIYSRFFLFWHENLSLLIDTCSSCCFFSYLVHRSCFFFLWRNRTDSDLCVTDTRRWRTTLWVSPNFDKNKFSNPWFFFSQKRRQRRQHSVCSKN